MAERRVRATGKDSDGDMAKLCHSGQTWSPQSKANAISDITNGTHTYYVNESGSRSNVHVVGSGTSAYLRTAADNASSSNLDNLPDC